MRSRKHGRAAIRVGVATLTCAVGGALLTAAAGGEARHDAALATMGKVTYTRYCVACHGPTGRADGPLARDLTTAVPDLTTLATRSSGTYPYDRVVKIITHGESLKGHGSADMPAWGDAFKKTEGKAAPTVDEAIRNLSHYIWSLQQLPG
jgi:mono/diheme cytochrome c family protein